jgi:hypothetical protein
MTAYTALGSGIYVPESAAKRQKWVIEFERTEATA